MDWKWGRYEAETREGSKAILKFEIEASCHSSSSCVASLLLALEEHL